MTGLRKKDVHSDVIKQRRLVIVIIVFFFLSVIKAQHPYSSLIDEWKICSARVMDAETGEPLPFAIIYSSDGCGTITNEDGYFQMRVSSGGHIDISFIGYEKKTILIDSMKSVINMIPITTAMREVEIKVSSGKEILKKVSSILRREYKRSQKERSSFILRAMNKDDCRLNARSAVNLRDIELSSSSYANILNEINDGFMQQMHLLDMLELSAQIHDSHFWRNVINPLDNTSSYVSNYSVITDKDGQSNYKIDITETKGKIRRPCLVGSLYVDAKTYHLMRFDGEVINMNNAITTVPSKLSFKIGYIHSSGFTEVAYISLDSESGIRKSHAFFFNVGRYISFTVKLKGTANISGQSELERAKELSKKAPLRFFVPRTEEERRIIKEAIIDEKNL